MGLRCRSGKEETHGSWTVFKYAPWIVPQAAFKRGRVRLGTLGGLDVVELVPPALVLWLSPWTQRGEGSL